jgi:antitoxin MazE
MKVAKWGNSLAIRLPAGLVEVLALKEGDEIDVQVTGERALEVEKRPSRLELLERLRTYRGMIPADFKFDRLEIHDRS